MITKKIFQNPYKRVEIQLCRGDVVAVNDRLYIVITVYVPGEKHTRMSAVNLENGCTTPAIELDGTDCNGEDFIYMDNLFKFSEKDFIKPVKHLEYIIKE